MTILHEIKPSIIKGGPGKRENYNIYIIDDDFLLNELIEHRLKKAGFNLSYFATGEEFLATLDDVGQNTLLVIDYMLPDMDGHQLAQELAERGRDIPFIVATGYGDEQLAVELMKLGALDYVVKDCNYLSFLPEVLDQAICHLNTEAKLQHTAKQLRDKESRYSLLFEQIPDAVFTANERGYLIEFNAAFVDLLSEKQQQLQGTNISQLFASDLCFHALMETLKEEGHLKDFEVQLQSLSGKVVDCVLSAVLLTDRNGAPSGIQGIIRDVTARKQVVDKLMGSKEKLEEQNLQLTEMATALRTLHDSITNDLRAPLWRLDGYCQAVFDQYKDEFDERGKDYLRQIRKDSTRVTRFVNDAINLSRISDAPVIRTRVDLSALVNQVLEEVSFFSEHPEVTTSVAENLYVNADKPLLSVMLRVLITNAMDLLQTNPESEFWFGRDKSREKAFCLCLDGIRNLSNDESQPFLPLYEPGINKKGVNLISATRIIALHDGRIWKERIEPGNYKVLFTLE